MFWGVTLDSGKRYSKVTDESYHLSMAALEPSKKELDSTNKYVSLKLEHKNSEYLLCTLEYGKVLQVALDIVISKGESTCFSLSGEGTVHLTGYYIDDDEAEDLSRDLTDLSSEVRNANKLKDRKLVAVEDDDDDDDEDDDDYDPSESRSKKSIEEEMDSEDEESETAIDSDSDVAEVNPENTMQKKDSKTTPVKSANAQDAKRKNDLQVQGRIQKKQKSDSTPSKTVLVSPEAVKQQHGKLNSKSNADEEEESDEDEDEETEESEDEEEEDSEDSSEDGAMNSSIGRTPMPSKEKRSAQAMRNSSLDSSLVELQSKKSAAKSKGNSKDNIPTLVPISSKNSFSPSAKNVLMIKNVGGVQIEDLRLGNGPQAKNGRSVSIHYVGKLPNGKQFDSNEPPKKPFSFRIGGGDVIKGFDMGILGMKVGGKRKITIPPQLGYGNKKTAGIPPNSTLIFVLDLKAVI